MTGEEKTSPGMEYEVINSPVAATRIHKLPSVDITATNVLPLKSELG